MDRSFRHWLGCVHCERFTCEPWICSVSRTIELLDCYSDALFCFGEIAIHYDTISKDHDIQMFISNNMHDEIYLCKEDYLDVVFSDNVNLEEAIPCFWKNLIRLEDFMLENSYADLDGYIILYPTTVGTEQD